MEVNARKKDKKRIQDESAAVVSRRAWSGGGGAGGEGRCRGAREREDDQPLNPSMPGLSRYE